MFRLIKKLNSSNTLAKYLVSHSSIKNGIRWSAWNSYCNRCERESSCDPQTKIKTPNYCITRATVQDRPKILSLLCKTFFSDEPLIVDVGLTGNPSEELKHHSVSALGENLSLVAVSPAGEIIGAALNGIQYATPDPEKHRAELAACKCPKTYKLLQFWAHVEAAACISRFGVSHALELKILVTLPASRGQGIAKALIANSRMLARDMRYPLMRIDCTSHYTAMAAERLGFDCVYSLDYKDYLGDDSKPVFCPNPPHCAVKVYTVDLNT